VADRVEATLQERPEKEISTADIGGFVMEELKRLDKSRVRALRLGVSSFPGHQTSSPRNSSNC